MTDLNDHPFSPQSVAFESGAPGRRERDWLLWCATVETGLGHDLDGDEEQDGYSIDYAHDAWRRGVTPGAYRDAVRMRKAQLSRA